MSLKRVILLVFCIVAASAIAHAGATDLSSIELDLGEVRKLNVSVQNPLGSSDTIRLDFGGGAVNQGVVNLSIPSSFDCTSDHSSCNISVSAQSSVRVPVKLTATAVGQETFIIKGTSRTTQLSSEDSMRISIDPVTQNGVFSSPGLTANYLLVLTGLAAGAYYYLLQT